jgi:hypothetical protein
MRKDSFIVVSASVTACFILAVGCTTTKPKAETKLTKGAPVDDGVARDLAQVTPSDAFATTAYGKLLLKLKLNSFEANLHAHHFMGIHGSKKRPLSLADALTPGPCKADAGSFPMDDGRPCRDMPVKQMVTEKDANGNDTQVERVVQVNSTVVPSAGIDLGSDSPDLTEYFRDACDYAREEGKLEVFFMTPHTKNNGVNENPIETSTSESEIMKRQAMLDSMNPYRHGDPAFVCGLGQEASSISSGNHVNIFGQFHAGGKDEKPIFFPPGDFKSLYSQVKARNDAGGKVFLQFNHPDVLNDLFIDSFTKIAANKQAKKTALNDYGLDDFAPMGCLTGKLTPDNPDCANVPAADKPTMDLIRQTYANARSASGNPFRLIEVIPPGSAAEGEAVDTNGDGTPDVPADTSFGATTNSKTNFRRVSHRTDANSYEDGIYDMAFYLAMGFKLGPTADQDNHHANWGTATASRTGILASNLRESTVLDAMAARHVYASEDVNATILLSQLTGPTRRIMGDTVKVTTPTTKLQIAYYDPNDSEKNAHVRLYYYRASDPIDFSPLISFDANNKFHKDVPKSAFRTVSFGAKNAIKLPAPDAADRSPNDLIPIHSGDVLSLTLPVSKGVQWVFAEIVQDGDFDKIWSAPIWIERK